MRIITRAMLVMYWRRNSRAKTGLVHWHKLTKVADWRGFQDVRATFPHADPVRVRSGRNVVVFDIGGNKYRLITAIHYDRGRVYTLMILSHKEYNQGRWKDIL